MRQYYNLHIDYCELRIPDMSIYWVVGGIGIKLMQYHTYMKRLTQPCVFTPNY